MNSSCTFLIKGILLLSFLSGCEVNTKSSWIGEDEVLLTLDSHNGKNNQYIRVNNNGKRIVVNYFSAETSNGNEPYRIRSFYRKDKGFYEQKVIKGLENHTLDTISLLMLSIKMDTTYKFTFDLDRYPPLHPLGSEDFSLTIRREGEHNFVSKKVYTNDSSIQEIIKFNPDYNIIAISLIDDNDTLEFKRRDAKK